MDRIQGPIGLFNVSQMPRFIADSSAAPWQGAFFTDLVAAGEGVVDHAHQLFCFQRTLVPFRFRKAGSHHHAWSTELPGLRVWAPGEEQRFEWSGGGARQFLFVHPAHVEAVLEKPWHTIGAMLQGTPLALGRSAESLMDAMRMDILESSPTGAMAGDLLVAALLAHVRPQEDGNKAMAPGSLSPAARRRVLECIEARLDTPLALAELARDAGVSVRHFSRAFSAAMGMPPHQYILRQRVERARILVSQGMPLAEVAQQVGFSDQSQLSRTFRRFTGCSPTAFRGRRTSMS
ncbi:AraC family transcriptional regulator [Acidovorax sp.]|jgi:AraC-like DNA-binding protein|uniref:AraC family transcriptional regulator n=1 Tax=Acidovorax sp. TaxID=1872122 RepID=UPI0025BE2C92|nr:AraC family transcriptional regulator [Acidovorax sp.]MCI5067831.1 AraC family transcriptional regulator [Acidovorax sp.]